jgi:hypothetical protein
LFSIRKDGDGEKRVISISFGVLLLIFFPITFNEFLVILIPSKQIAFAFTNEKEATCPHILHTSMESETTK